MKLLILAIVLACFIVTFGEKARYDNYRVYSVEIQNEKQLKVLQELEKYRDGSSFMHSPASVLQNVDILVPPHKFAFISDLFETYDMGNSIKIDNVQKLIDMDQPTTLCSDFPFSRYNDLSVFNKWLDKLLKRYPDVVTDYVYGKSYENRPLRAVKVSHRPGNPTIFIQSTIHAREWISAATASYLLNQLLTSRNVEIRELANNFDWVFVLITNPDGYEYSHKKDRMWRKSRSLNPGSPCIGVDLSRNFDFHHGGAGASQDPCSDTYAGPKGFSEPETLALSKFIETFDNIKLFLTLHSYGQLLMFPYAYTKEHAVNHNDLNQIGQAAIQAIRKRYRTEYVTGSIAETIYYSSGGETDWMYAVQNVSLAYAVEFRDKGRFGFLLPPYQIVPNSLEFIDGLKAMLREAKLLHYF